MAKPNKEFLERLSALADSLRRQIDANLDGWDMSRRLSRSAAAKCATQ